MLKSQFFPFVYLCIILSALSISSAWHVAPADSVREEISETADTNDLLFRKRIPKEVERAAKEALKHYPELQDKRIIFKYDHDFNNAFMQAQPVVTSMFKDRDRRVYKIIMTREMKVNDKKIPVEDLPHKVLVGWIGHELGHIMDYTHRSTLNMAWFGFRYVTSERYKKEAEREADLFAIKHGLSDEIIATKNFILSNTSLPESYIAKIKRLYLSPERVLEIVDELEDELEEEADDEAVLNLQPSLIESQL